MNTMYVYNISQDKTPHPIGAFTESVNSNCEKSLQKKSWQEVPFSGGLAVKKNISLSNKPARHWR
jgi:hypothetical protein